MNLIAVASLEEIDRAELNRCLVAWRHAMGPCVRPTAGWSHGLRADGRLVAVLASDTLIRAKVAGLSRDKAIELSRLCAERPELCRVVLRLWREFVFRPLAQSQGLTWALSYQDERLHNGDTYRFDGWVRLARSRSGTDRRSGRRGRNKTVWGWTANSLLLAACRADASIAARSPG